MPVEEEHEDDGDEEPLLPQRATSRVSEGGGGHAIHAPAQQPQVHDASQCAHHVAGRDVLRTSPSPFVAFTFAVLLQRG